MKTSRIVVRDGVIPNLELFKSKLYHLYMNDDVKDNLNRSNIKPHDPLPELVINAYLLLGEDWRLTKIRWDKIGHKVPPVMITVTNRTETAERIEYVFEHNKIPIPQLCDSRKILRIDSKILSEAESVGDTAQIVEQDANTKKQTLKERAELLRRKVNTVGQVGEPGGEIQHVISVAMLSEGWDARTVTHIMGLRAFSSQLLCEQVVGRGLRRTAYEINKETNLYNPEHVNIFGIPFTFLPHESADISVLKPTEPKTKIAVCQERSDCEIKWPNIARINYHYKPHLSVDINKVDLFTVNVTDAMFSAELADMVGGQANLAMLSNINLEKLAQLQRMQTIIFQISLDIYEKMNPSWNGNKIMLVSQIVRIAEQFLLSEKIRIRPIDWQQDVLKKQLALTFKMGEIVEHIWQFIKYENKERIDIIFTDSNRSIGSTKDMQTWYTAKPCKETKKSHINACVSDSGWELNAACVLDEHPSVISWVKNDHLGFEISYIYQGITRKYRPDFIVKRSDNLHIILEIKGKDSEEVRAKQSAAEEWTKAVNSHGGFGMWCYELIFEPREVKNRIDKAKSVC